MRMVLLEHDPILGVPPGHAGALPAGWTAPPGTTGVVTFRAPAKGKPDETIRGVKGVTRFLDPLGEHVLFYALETDSVLAPLLLWDAAHALPVGGTITLAGEAGGEPYLSRAYFKHGLAAEKSAAGPVFRKTAPLLAERDRGLDRWSFGIPTGPGDATGLNACVKRILELDVPTSEIILCGVPGENFKYRDQVRIVGEELTNPPVYIGRKKNVLAEAARYENLCLLHDRVFLPSDFHAAVTRFGDLFPVTAFQTLWFDDPHHLVYRRYSDYNRMLNPWLLDTLTGTDGFTPDLFAEIERCGFLYQNPLRYHQNNYCNGSLYLAKRSVWRYCPQLPQLMWSQFEDVEHGMRCSRHGIPSRINPFGYAQTLFARPGILGPGVAFENPQGHAHTTVGLLDTAGGFRRKPLMKVSKVDAVRRLQTFARKRVPGHLRDSCWAELSAPPNTTATWLKQIGVAVYAAAIGFGSEGVTEFVSDYEKHLLGDELGYGTRRFVQENFAAHAALSRDLLVENSAHLEHLLLIRPHQHLFYDSLAEYFPEDTWKLRLGSRLAAWRLGKHNGKIFYHPDGADGYLRAIRNSTPFRRYYEGAK